MDEYYLDCAATTKVDEMVLKAMSRFFLEDYGNPSSIHLFGETALKELKKAKEIISKEINCKPWEIYFCSGGTEADNLALLGLAGDSSKKKKILISSIEHAAVYKTAKFLESYGYKILEIPVNSEGFVDLDFIKENLDSNTLVVSVIHGNNVFGTLQFLDKIGKICRERGVLFHTDAVQTFGKEDIDVKKQRVDLLSASAHKIGGPKGVGFLYVSDSVRMKPVILGGGQEKGLRSGTENVPGIVGFRKALEVSKKISRRRLEKSRNYFIKELEKIGGQINGSKIERLYGNIHVSFSDVDGEALVLALSQKKIYVSTGSACDSKKDDDRVLSALGISSEQVRGGIRISFNEPLENKEIKYIVGVIGKIVNSLKRKA